MYPPDRPVYPSSDRPVMLSPDHPVSTSHTVLNFKQLFSCVCVCVCVCDLFKISPSPHLLPLPTENHSNTQRSIEHQIYTSK